MRSFICLKCQSSSDFNFSVNNILYTGKVGFSYTPCNLQFVVLLLLKNISLIQRYHHKPWPTCTCLVQPFCGGGRGFTIIIISIIIISRIFHTYRDVTINHKGLQNIRPICMCLVQLFSRGGGALYIIGEYYNW